MERLVQLARNGELTGKIVSFVVNYTMVQKKSVVKSA
jgi:hypothetical protein